MDTIYNFLINALGGWIQDYPYILGTASICVLMLIFTALYNVLYALEYLIRGGR